MIGENQPPQVALRPPHTSINVPKIYFKYSEEKRPTQRILDMRRGLPLPSSQDKVNLHLHKSTLHAPPQDPVLSPCPSNRPSQLEVTLQNADLHSFHRFLLQASSPLRSQGRALGS